MKTMKTNSKKYLANMEKYLLGQIDGTDYGVKTDTPTEKINFVFDCFNTEYECEYEKRRTPNNQERFGGWLSGLPSCIDIPFYNVDILALAKELQEIKGETKKSWEDAVLKNYWNFMSLHIHKLRDRIYAREMANLVIETNSKVLIIK